MKHNCSFCGRTFYRDDRAFFSDKFCPLCIEDRIVKSGARKFEPDKIKMQFNKSGYLMVK